VLHRIISAALSRVICAMLLLGSLPAMQNSSPLPAQASAPASLPTQAPPPPQRGFRIAGIVVDALTGRPIPSASVAIAPLTHGEERDISKSVVTGADGRFSFAGLSQGKYSLNGRARGFSFQAYDHHDQYATAIATGPGLDSEHLVFRLQPDASVEGDVTDENNDPVQYAMVRLFSTKSRDGLYGSTAPIDQTQTDDQGHYHLGHLDPAGYYLAVSARPWYAQNVRAPNPYNPSPQNANSYSPDAGDDANLDVTYPLTFYPDVTDSADATPLELAPGERETANIVLRAVPALHLRIRTAGSAPNPIIGRMIFPRVSQRIFGGYLDSVYNAPDSWVAPGVLEVSGLAPGHYVIEIPASTGSSEKGGSKGWYREIDLSGDADISASEAPGFVTITGTILFENSAVPKGASIQLLNPDTGETFRGEVDDKGEFDFPSDNVRAGRYLLSLSTSGFYLKKVVATGARLSGRAIDIGPNGNVRLAAIASRGEGRVDGAAMRDNEPFAGAMIVLIPQDPANNFPLFRRDQSDSDGTFTLAHVVPGQYAVIAIANGWDLEWANPAVLQPYLKHGEIVQVPADGRLQVKVQVQ